MRRLQARGLLAHLGWPRASNGASQSVMRSGMSLSRSLSKAVADFFAGMVLRFFGASATAGSVELVEAASWCELLVKKWTSIPQLLRFLEYGINVMGEEF